MREKKDFSYYEFEVGRYLPGICDDRETFKPYKPDNKKLVWNVFNEENGKIVPINIFEYNWKFLEYGLLEAKKLYKDDFVKFADHIRGWLANQYWSRCEYETVITSWPPYIEREEFYRLIEERDEERDKAMWKYGGFYRTDVNLTVGYKMDIYTQVMMNWDRFIEYVWNNKHLITKKKLGLLPPTPKELKLLKEEYTKLMKEMENPSEPTEDLKDLMKG